MDIDYQELVERLSARDLSQHERERLGEFKKLLDLGVTPSDRFRAWVRSKAEADGAWPCSQADRDGTCLALSTITEKVACGFKKDQRACEQYRR
jgi:hypothetical protein